MQLAHRHTQRDEGQWMGEVQLENYPVAQELIRRYNAVQDRRVCPHLQDDWDQTRVWVDAVPELLACEACVPVLAEEEANRANTCCVMCGDHVPLRGVSVAVEGMLLRGGICDGCEPEHAQRSGSGDSPLQPIGPG